MMKRIDITISEIHIKKLKQLSKQGGDECFRGDKKSH